jgi:hypothetical protein
LAPLPKQPKTWFAAGGKIAQKMVEKLHTRALLGTITGFISTTAALLASSCCPIQLVLNYMHLPCAGFAVLSNYRSISLSFMVGSLIYKWISTLTNKASSMKKIALMLCCTIAIILLAYSDYLTSGELPSDQNLPVIHVQVDGVQLHGFEEVKSIIQSNPIVPYLYTSMTSTHRNGTAVFSFKSINPYSSVNTTLLEEYLSQNKIKAQTVMGICKNETTPSELKGCDAHILLNDVKCSGCFDAATGVMLQYDSFIGVVDSQFLGYDEQKAIFHVKTTQAIDTEMQKREIAKQLEAKFRTIGKDHFKVHKIVSGVCD